MDEIIRTIFVFFSAQYGNLWEKSRDETTWPATFSLWGECLSKYSEEILIDSATNCHRFHKEFPPTLGQFVDIVKQNLEDKKMIELQSAKNETIKYKNTTNEHCQFVHQKKEFGEPGYFCSNNAVAIVNLKSSIHGKLVDFRMCPRHEKMIINMKTFIYCDGEYHS